MHVHFKTGMFVAGGAAFLLMTANMTNVGNALRITFKPSPPGKPAVVITHASVPQPAIITKQNPGGFTLKINTQGNPYGTEYAVWESSIGKWVDPLAKKIASATPVWASDLGAWDTPRNGIALAGLEPNKAYTLFVKARNSAKEESGFSPAALGITVWSPDAPTGSTVARIIDDENDVGGQNANTNTNVNADTGTSGLFLPGRPSVIRLNPKELLLTIDANGNTSSTSFAIQDAVSGKYVQANGLLGAAPLYRIFLDWGGDSGFVIKTEPNRTYRFQVIAKPRGEW